MKTIIITGANSGLGFETAKKIARNQDYKVIIACRNSKKAQKAVEEIKESTKSQTVEYRILDTSSLQSVRDFVSQIIEDDIKVDGLICNAGISSANSGITEDGFELVFATNHLGHFLLTNLLLPHMTKYAKIIHVSSDMHNPPDGIEWPGTELLAFPLKEDRKKYSYSKLCNLYFTYELDRRLQKENSQITVNAFNPGFMADTNFSGGMGKARALMVKTTMPDRYGTLETSSDALAELIINTNYDGISGKYFDRSTTAIKSSPLSYNKEYATELWNVSLKLCEIDS